MSSPSRRSGTTAFPQARAPMNSVPVYEVVKTRILVKLPERLDPAKAKRMPASLFREAARQQIEQLVEAEAHRLHRPDRERLIEEVFAEAFGFGPLEELFADSAVAEVMVLGPHAVLARRGPDWMPTNVKFRDLDHLREVLHKLSSRGEAVGDPLPGSVTDVKLGNGFRAVAVVPPRESGVPATVAFVRMGLPVDSLGGGVSSAVISTAATTRTPPPVGAASGRIGSPAARAVSSGEAALERHRLRITERLIGKLASLGVYDLSRVDVGELRKVIAAYVDEYAHMEKIFLGDADRSQLTREILAGMNR